MGERNICSSLSADVEMALDSCSSGTAIEKELQQINLNDNPFGPDHCKAKALTQAIENFPSEPKIAHAPARPAENDSVGWQRFLAAYQSGKWESCDDEQDIDSTQDSPSEDLNIVYDSQGTPMDNKGKPLYFSIFNLILINFSLFTEYFNHYLHLAAPNLPPSKRRKRHEAL